MSLAETYTECVKKLLDECLRFYGKRLISFCLYGSVARGTMTPASDIDFLLVIEPLPDGRMRRVKEFEHVESGLVSVRSEARKQGAHIELSPVLKRPFEVERGSLLFLDMLEDGKILFDRDDFLKRYFGEWKKKLDKLGARRIHKGDAWYWILKEDYKPGEVFEL